MKRLSFFIISFLSLFIFSCEYELHKEYVNDIPGPDSTRIQITLDPNQDTIKVYCNPLFSLDVITQGNTWYGQHIYIDGKELGNLYYENGKLLLYLDNYGDGLHTFTVEIFTKSGTGSIADLNEKEKITFRKTWILILDKTTPAVPVNLTKVFNNDGILKIEWEKYSLENFKSYKLFKIYCEPGTNYLTCSLQKEIRDRNQDYYYDSTYVGGEVRYFIQSVALNETKVKGDTAKYFDREPELGIKWIKDDLVELIWDKCKYYKVFKEYRISIYSPFYDTMLFIDDINNNSYTGRLGRFMVDQYCTFEIITNKYLLGYPGYKVDVNFTIGEPFISFDRINKISARNQLFFQVNNKLLLFDQTTNSFLDSLFTYDSWVNGVHSLGSDAMLISYPDKVSKVDLNSFTEQLLQGIILSSNNLSSNAYGVVNSYGTHMIYDFNHLKEYKSLEWGDYSNCYLSNDSKLLFKYASFSDYWGLNCYEITDNGLVLKWTKPNCEMYSIPDETDLIFLFNRYANEISIFNYKLAEIVKTFKFDNCSVTISDIDSDSGILLLKIIPYLVWPESEQELCFFDYNKGSILKKIKIDDSDFQDYYYNHGELYASGGKKMNINF